MKTECSMVNTNKMHNFVADWVVDVLGLMMSKQLEKIKVVNSQHTLRMYNL